MFLYLYVGGVSLLRGMGQGGGADGCLTQGAKLARTASVMKHSTDLIKIDHITKGRFVDD